MAIPVSQFIPPPPSPLVSIYVSPAIFQSSIGHLTFPQDNNLIIEVLLYRNIRNNLIIETWANFLTSECQES